MFTFRPGTHRQILICCGDSYRFELSHLSFVNGIYEARLIFVALRKKYVSKVSMTDEECGDLDACLSIARDWLIDQGYVEQG